MRTEKEHKRCAVYTRKSTEDGLELKYNSLDAQYDACSAYIRSQVGMGWELIEKRYDDGGFSGGNMKRPAMQELLTDIKSGLVDVVVVYKIDRLSRSLLDFTDLFRVFEDHHVSFVSVTQQIDTSTATGRMMLNILMSFAQFEREMDSDRIRDKVYSQKKNGFWCGGIVPYGYIVRDKQLIIDPYASKAVVHAFNRYPELGSTYAVATELNTLHPRPDGDRWDSRNVLRILRNAIYEGLIHLKRTNETFQGVHEPIVTKEAFDRVQKALLEGSASSKPTERKALLAPLKGLLRCGTCGSAMSPSYSYATNSTKKRFVYYRCSKSAKASDSKCEVEHVSGDKLEKFVFSQLEDILRRDDVIEILADGNADRKDEFLENLDNMETFWDKLMFAERERLFHLLLKDVVIWSDKIAITFAIAGVPQRIINCCFRNDSGRTYIFATKEKESEVEDLELSTTKMLRKAHAWIELMSSGTYANKRDLAAALGVSASYITKMLRFPFFSPRIIEAIRTGARPDISVEKLSKVTSVLWEEQERRII